MPKSRALAAKQLLRGCLTAVAVTLAATVLLAAALIYLKIGDRLLYVLNQVTKLSAVLLGTCAAVPRGGSGGFATGVFIALFYTMSGAVLYVLLGGGALSVPSMLGEMTVCAAVGAVTGAIRANLSPRRRTRAAV